MKNPPECKECPHFYTGGIKDGKHNRWCTGYGKPAAQAIGKCREDAKNKRGPHSPRKTGAAKDGVTDER